MSKVTLRLVGLSSHNRVSQVQHVHVQSTEVIHQGSAY
jgi:hypothetical protein